MRTFRWTLLIIVTFSGLISAVTPALVRDPFLTHRYWYYVPVRNDGTLWTRYCIGGPSVTYSTYYCLLQMHIGPIRPGIALNRAQITAESGTWNNLQANEWNYRSSANQNDYLEFAIPLGYNFIQVITYDVTGGNGAMLAISWDDDTTTGLSTTSIDTGLESDINFWTVATAAAGGDDLKILHNDASGSARIIGIRAFDTDGGPVHPGELNAGGLWKGNGLIDSFDNLSSNLYHEETSIVTDTYIMTADMISAMGWAINWGDNGGTKDWTGGAAHFIAGDYEYQYADGKYPDGPELIVDGVSQGNLANETDIPCAEVHQSAQIAIISKGLADTDIASGANDPCIGWTMNLHQYGIDMNFVIDFQNAMDVTSTNFYSPMMTFWPDRRPTEMVDVATGNTTAIYPGNGDVSVDDVNTIDLSFSYVDAVLRLSASHTVYQAWWYDSTPKFYMRQKVENFRGGTDPTAHDIWSWSCSYMVYDKGHYIDQILNDNTILNEIRRKR